MLWNQRRVTQITLLIQSFKICWKFQITRTNHLLWVSICFWSYSPMTQPLLHSPHWGKEPRVKQLRQLQRIHSLRGTTCLERFCRCCPRVPSWLLHTGGTCSKDVFLHLWNEPVLARAHLNRILQTKQLPHSPSHQSGSAIQINPQNILV